MSRLRLPVRWLALGGLVVVIAVIGLRTSSLASTLELVAVLGVLLGLAVAFGGLEPRRRASVPPGAVAPDAATSALAADSLDSLDSIEHRCLDLGMPWPRLVVGPTGAAVVDVCTLPGPIAVRADGLAAENGRTPCPRCAASARVAASLRDALEREGVAAPVRFLGVVARGTDVTIALDSPGDVSAVPVDELADALSRGPVLPMATVDRAFSHLARTAATGRGLVPH